MSAFIGQLTRARSRSVTRFCKWQRFGPKPQSRRSKAQAIRKGAPRGAHKKPFSFWQESFRVMTERYAHVWARRRHGETPVKRLGTIASQAPRSSRDLSAHYREPRLEEILA